MAYMTWSDDYSVGVSIFDEEHKALVGLVNALHESMMSGQSKQKVFEILDRLIGYTVDHFAHEEALFRQTGYTESVSHKIQHEKLKDQVGAFRVRAEKSVSGSLIIELSRFLQDWLVQHIQHEDKRYGPFLNAKGIV